jgi:hypothetical protein
MMDFFTHCWKRSWHRQIVAGLLTLAFSMLLVPAFAQQPVDVSTLKVERADEDVLVSAQVQFDLPNAVEDALQKGVPLYFVVEADVLRGRWYWYDKKVVTAERQLRLAYQPLTKRWRLTVTSGSPKSSNLGLALNQSYETLAESLAAIKRVSRWKIADVGELDTSVNYRVEFRFRLDVGRLPLPFQIGTIGQADWNVSIVLGAPLQLETLK